MTPPLHAIPFVGALLLLITALAMNVTRMRMLVGVRLGDGGNKRLGYTIRAHGNALEHGLVLSVALVLAEVAGMQPAWVVGLGWVILAARVGHAAGFLKLGKKVVYPAVTVTYLVELGLAGYLGAVALR